MATVSIPEKAVEPGQADRIPGYAWVVMSLPWTLVVLGAVLTFAIGVMLPSMRSDLGFGPAEAGYLSSISWFLTALVTIPLTAVVNKIGPKAALIVVFFVVGVCILAQGMAPSYATLIISRAVGLGLVAAITPAMTLIKQMWVPMKRITTVNGVEAFTNPAGQILSTALVPFLLIWFAGWRTTFYVLGVLVLILAVAWLVFGKERHTAAYDAGMKGEKGQSALGQAAKHPAIWLLALGWPGTTLVWIAFFTFWPTFATERLGIPMTEAGLILSLLPIGSAIASLVSPIITNRIGKEKFMIWIWGFILPLAYFSMLLTPNPILLGIGSFVAGFGAFAFVPPGFSLPYKLPGIKPSEVAMGMSIMMTIITVGGGLGGVVAGSIYQSTGDLYRALALCCLSPLTLAIFGLFLPERGRLAMEKEAREKEAAS